MGSRDFGAVLKEVQTLFSVGTVAALSDDYLLDSFLSRHEGAAEVAFEALVRRHGPMVLRVCRGELRDAHAAEDAFQATFLILARRAGAIRKHGSVASWLFGVARRVAQRARAERTRREAHERRSAVMADDQVTESDHRQTDLMPEIQEEVDRLPEKYRSPIVLCYLEGLTHEEAASQLRVPVGTVKVRLSRARERLRGRLVRRGLAPIVLAATVGGKASGAVPTPLLNLTVKAALQFAVSPATVVSASIASLVDGVIKAMYLSKLKTTVALLATSLAAIFASLLAVAYFPRPARSDQPVTVLQAPAQKPVPKAAPSKTEAAAKGVAVETLKRSDFNRETNQSGTVEAAQSAEVYPRTSGYLKSLSVDIGDAVKRGQVLAEISEPELDAAVRRSQALVRQAEAKVQKARSLHRVARSEVEVQKTKVAESVTGLERSEAAIRYRQKLYDRIKELVAKKQVEPRLADEERSQLENATSARNLNDAQIDVAKAGLDETQAKLEAAQADVLEAEAGLLIAHAELEHSKIRLSFTKIESPLDGIVTRRGYHQGEFVRSGTDAGSVPLLSVVGAQKMKVVVHVNDVDIRFLDKGDPVKLNIAGREYPGTIARTAFAEDPVKQTLRAEIDVDNSDAALRPGQSGLVTIIHRHRSNVLSIPITAFRRNESDGAVVCFRIVDGRAVRTRIKVGEVNGNRLEVLEGLHEGDTVVADPHPQISDGQLIKAKTQPKDKKD